MSRINRRRFTWVATSGFASAALVACSGDAVKDDITPTRIADVEGAPPTLAPNATPFSSSGDEAAADEGGGEAAAGGGGEPITVTGLDALAFDPESFEATPGQEIHFVNGGALQHDFVIDELDMATELLNGGDEQTITVPEDAAPGEYTYYCSVPGHREAGMEGTMTVVEGGGEAAAASDEEEAPAEETEEAAAAAGDGGGAAGPITVVTLDSLAFDPSEFEASPGQEIHVVNEGVMQHDFIIDELDMATDLLNNGEEQTITVPEDAEVGQSYTFYCSVPGHRQAGMEGTMTIVEAGGGDEAAAASDEEESGEATEEAAAAPADPVDPSQPVEVTALDTLAFDPSELVVAPGQSIMVTNEGVLEHDFVVDEWGLATALLRQGETGELVVPGNAEVGASYTYYCSVAGHAAAGMQGTLTVAEAIGGAEAAEGSPAAEATEEGVQVESGAEIEPDAIRVASLDSMRFAPSQFSAAPGQQIHLVNPGVLVHDIVVDEWGLDSGALGGGEETTFRIPDDVEVGSEVEFYCSVPGHRESGMVGTITIIEADVTQEEAVTPAAEATPVDSEEAAAAATPAESEEAAAEASPVAEDGGAAASGDTLEVVCIDIAYEETEMSMPADTDVDIHVVNTGFLEHDFNIEDTDFATDILPGASDAEETITVNLPAGEYVYYCSVPGHREAGMEGTLTVE